MFNASLCELGPVWLKCYHWSIKWFNWMNISYEKMRLNWNFKGNPSGNCSVCKDVRNLKWLVSWNSNNHSSPDRVEWIMSWGVAGGPHRRTWSSLRRGGDLPWERSGEYSMCPDSTESGNRYRCKPPRAPTSLTRSGYRVYNFGLNFMI